MSRFWRFIIVFALFHIIDFDVPWGVYYCQVDVAAQFDHLYFLDLNSPVPSSQ